MCVMSTESNGKLLKVFSKSFVFAKLLFVDHGLAEQLDARWNWSIVLSFKQVQDKFLFIVICYGEMLTGCATIQDSVRSLLLPPELLSSLVSSEYSEQSFKPGSG